MAGIVIHAAGAHQRQQAGGGLAAQRLGSAKGVAALAGQGGGHHRQVAAGHLDRTLAEVEVEADLRVLLDHQAVAQQMADRPVAVAGVPFRGVDGSIDAEGPAGQFGEVGQQLCLGPLSGMAPDLGGGGDRPGIDHRVAGDAALRIEADGIEGLAGRLHPHLAVHVVL